MMFMPKPVVFIFSEWMSFLLSP